ncbi:NXNL2-like protein [Mya arenaria]|uniref:NXNL2-like protein n=1 Tax=Mya arenaria TaxID=6604 RepID=A0ABY7FNW5_MYAAR|nr:nucleoredoxin-like protein 2 [Mya arenaria]WAR23009.1 NXNL2-like protein [Mya arenaria]
MDLFRDKYLFTKEYYEKKVVTPDEETLTQQLNLTNFDKKPDVKPEDQEVPGRVLGHVALDEKLVGLYFSAGWCPPCQQFTPLLCDLYDELLNRKANFEVVFLSFDRTADEMEKYFMIKHRSWLALPNDDPFKDELKMKYNVTAVPKLIIVSRGGEVVTAKGRKEVQDKGVIAFRNWQQAAATLEAKQQALGNTETTAASGDGAEKALEGLTTENET